jgi:hypothetical protein
MPGQGRGVKGHFDGSHRKGAEKFPLSAEERRELVELHSRVGLRVGKT